MTIDYKALASQAAEYEDQTETTTGGGDYEARVIPAGATVGRLIEYIELGVQPQRPYLGQEKKPAEEVRLTFELLNPKTNIYEIDIEGAKKKVADRISLTLTKSLNEKSKYTKLFRTLARGRSEITHLAQCLGEAFIITVVHNEVEKDGKKTVYFNITKDGAYLIQAPVIVDPIAQTATPIPVPESLSPIRIFLWGIPTKETWDSLFIEGTRLIKDAKGVTKEESKNWIQRKILSATNFSGSALEDLLSGAQGLTAALNEPELEVAPTKTKEQVKAQSKGKVKEPAPDTSDPLAALGLLG